MRNGTAIMLMLCVPSLAAAHAKVGQSAPPFVVTTFDKRTITSDTFKGQVVILNFWATWCGPCKQELPMLDAYYRMHAQQGLRIFAVTTENSVPDYLLEPLSGTLGFPLAHRISGSAFGEIDGVPTNYVIDRNGIVRYANSGAFDQEGLDEVVGPLLAEPAFPSNSVTASAN